MFAGQFEDYSASSPHLYDGVKFCNSEKMIFVSYDPQSDGENHAADDLEMKYFPIERFLLRAGNSQKMQS